MIFEVCAACLIILDLLWADKRKMECIIGAISKHCHEWKTKVYKFFFFGSEWILELLIASNFQEFTSRIYLGYSNRPAIRMLLVRPNRVQRLASFLVGIGATPKSYPLVPWVAKERTEVLFGPDSKGGCSFPGSLSAQEKLKMVLEGLAVRRVVIGCKIGLECMDTATVIWRSTAVSRRSFVLATWTLTFVFLVYS